MNIIDFFNAIKGKEIATDFSNSKFTNGFVPQKVSIVNIAIKEGFPGNIYFDFQIEGYIKDFPDFTVKTFRRKKIYENFKNTVEAVKFKEPLEEIFSTEDLIDMEENNLIDPKENLFLFKNFDIRDKEIEEEMKQKTLEEKIERFIVLTQNVISAKIEKKVLKFIKDTHEEQSRLDIPDEIKDYVNEKGYLKETRPYVPRKKEKPVLKISVKGFNTIPSVNSVIKKIQEGKKLNKVENIINKKLNTYIAQKTLSNISALLSAINMNLLKENFEREMLRDILISNGIKEINKETTLNICGEKIKTVINIKKNGDDFHGNNPSFELSR